MSAHKNYASRIREHLRTLPPNETARLKELSVDLDIPYRAVSAAIQDAVRRGVVEKIAPGRYRLAAEAYQPRPAPKRQTIYRACHSRGIFNIREITLLTGADKNYVGEVLRELTDGGDLEALPRQRDPETGGSAARWRVRHADKFYLRRVIGKEVSP